MEDPPSSKSKGDILREVARGAVSVIPIAGGAIQVLLENVFSEPIAKRREQWFQTLAEVITSLEEKVEGITQQALAKDDVFITIAMQATQVALRNHRTEKLNALRNAVYNSVVLDLEESEKMMFLRLIDELTPHHLLVLTLVRNPRNWMVKNNVADPRWSMVGLMQVIQHCIPELKGREEFIDMLISDLQSAGLVQPGRLSYTMMTCDGAMESRTTSFGGRFIDFISDPV